MKRRMRKHPVLLKQVVDDRLLLSVDPPGEQQKEEREGRRQRIHRGSVPDALPHCKGHVDSAEFPEGTPSSGSVNPAVFMGDPTSAEFSHRTR